MNSGPFAHLNQEPKLPRVLPESPVEAGTLLPPAFQFSQKTLQDYVDCARRFQLNTTQGIRWPAAESEPIDEVEHFMEQGAQFHLLVQRYLNGVDQELLKPADPLLARWWQHFLENPPPDLPEAKRIPEVMLSMPVGAQRLVARFDLVALDPGERIVIADWKTSRSRPQRQDLAARMQTRIYPFVMVEAGHHLFGGAIKPEQVEMIYWFAEHPTRPERFTYDSRQHQANHTLITGLIDDILGRDPESIWPLTDERRHCRYCVYRSLCERGVKAGRLDSGTDDLDPTLAAGDATLGFDLDDVDEIAF
ncbi:MAG: PD-(D/E)XK nuclease family protein [Chloroflexi bacterium]|nr:PD-(D/E)XK nuclease family protein [Chloroflexota bacterium]